MTESVNKFDMASQAIQNHARGAGFRRATADVVNLVAAFQARGITFGDNGNEK